MDADEITKLEIKEKIDGICTTGTDVAIVTVGKVCETLGLLGVSEEAAKIACNKVLMKKVYQECGVRTAECSYVDIKTEKQELERICEQIGYPVIFKAIDSSGSRGITKVKAAEDIDKAVQSVKEITQHSEYLIERFLEGEEFGAQGFVQDGKLEFILPHGDFVFKGDTGVPVGHYAPYNTMNLQADINRQMELAVKAMHLNHCALNVDFMLCDGKVYVLEIGARGGATCLVELVSLYYGFDYYEKILRVALGETVDFTPVNHARVPNASHLLLSPKSGIIKHIHNGCDLSLPWLKEVQFDYEEGDYVRNFRTGPDRIGHVIVTGETIEQAMKHLNLAMEHIEIDVA